MLSAVLEILDSTGARVDAALKRAKGTFWPLRVKLGTGLKALSVAANGPYTDATLGVDTDVIATKAYADSVGAVGGAVPTSRTLTATSPIQIDGGTSANLSANRTLSILASSGSNAGSMSAAHYSRVNNATDAATASTLVLRDGSGNFKSTTPLVASDVAIKSYVDGLMGIGVTKSITLSANNTAATVPLFTVVGTVRILEIYGIVTTALGSNHTGGGIKVDDGTLQRDLSNDATVDPFSAAPIGSAILRTGLSTDPLTFASSATVVRGDPAVANTPVLCEEIVIAKHGVTTQIVYRYVTTNTPTSGAIKWYVKFLALSDDGAVTAV